MSISEKYKIVKPLGSQKKRKFCNAFLVEDKTNKSLCVMKVLRKESGNAHLVARLVHESTFNFSDTNFPRTIDYYETEQELLLVRSYFDGETLDHYWSTLKKKERMQFLKLLIHKLIELFQVLEENQVVHCDIKPSNIIIGPQVNDFDVHLIDYGLAIHRGQLDSRNILFPLGFAAPELLLNHLDLVDQRTDIYALGVVIWRLFTGKLPLTHPNPSIFTNLQLTHPLPDHHDLPKGLYKILSKMCNKYTFPKPPNLLPLDEVINSLKNGRDGRYSSLTEVEQDLNALNQRRFTIKGLFGNRY